ncbi:hypothetical protein PIB30_090366 [Stylosanthes scabra]|uniref:Uncharacterized protein n=1 Tax=Stylosanthes scabra TaxID=79078 RepID=A0ABU6ZSX9_9FABA|nr:hypothetical protein [Stylosanthes scabra]
MVVTDSVWLDRVWDWFNRIGSVRWMRIGLIRLDMPSLFTRSMVKSIGMGWFRPLFHGGWQDAISTFVSARDQREAIFGLIPSNVRLQAKCCRFLRVPDLLVPLYSLHLRTRVSLWLLLDWSDTRQLNKLRLVPPLHPHDFSRPRISL